MSTLTATVVAAGVPPYASLQYRDTGGAVTAQVQRRDPNGTWVSVRTGEPATLVNGEWAAFDYELPYDVQVQYRAVPNVGAITTSQACVCDPRDAHGGPSTWIVHPGQPALSVRVDRDITLPDFTGIMLAAVRGTRTRSGNRALLRPWASKYAVVVTDSVRWAASATLTVKTSSTVAANVFEAIFESAQPLLLNPHPLRQHSFDRAYISVGDLSDDWDQARTQYRTWTVPYDEVQRPVGSYQVAWTSYALQQGYPQITDMMASFPKLTQLVANMPVE